MNQKVEAMPFLSKAKLAAFSTLVGMAIGFALASRLGRTEVRT